MASSGSQSAVPGVTSFQGTSENELLSQVSAAVGEMQAVANFTCGGSLPIDPMDSNRFQEFSKLERPMSCSPVTLRWDTKTATIAKVNFPMGKGNEDADNLQSLILDRVPATFGLQGQDVLDLQYRKAGKLDNTQFSTNFNPYDYGIVAAISQILLPGADIALPLRTANHSVAHRGVIAELYKLNIYSGPSGKFQAHVDTPRGLLQFGSLVVCLPCKHEGGQLWVKHKEVEKFFDWGNSDKINWAAFYSDCEHEVLQVTLGHRVTLTYNLYISEYTGAVLQRFPTVDPPLYPLFDSAKALLEQPDFMQKDEIFKPLQCGTLGFYCAHKYAHATTDANERLPWALKGVDVAIVAVFHSLGLNVDVCPILESTDLDEEEAYERTMRYNAKRVAVDSDSAQTSRVGFQFHPLKIVNEQPDGWKHTVEVLERTWPYRKLKNVKWLNRAVHHEYALSYLAYGNQAEMGYFYSHAAILVTVPSFQKRGSCGMNTRRQLQSLGTLLSQREMV